MGTVTGICTYHGEDAQDIPDLKHVRGVLYFGQGKVHCFKPHSPKQTAASVVRKKKVILPDFVPESKLETGERAKDLWESALKADLQPGIVEGRISGTAYKWDEERSFGFVRAADGTEYHVSRFEIFADEYNRKYLVIGEEISFRTKDRRMTQGNELSAVAVLPARVDLRASASVDHREEMVVVKYDNRRRCGRLRQVSNPMGSWIFFHFDEVITEGEVEVGTKVWAGFRRRCTKSKDFEAFAIEIFMEAKGEIA